MLRFLADENFDGSILRGLLRQNPELDIVRVQDTPVFQADDPTVLEWAAQEGRILLTRDVRTMPKYAYERVAAGLPMPGVIEFSRTLSRGQAIDEFLVILGAGKASDFENQVTYIHPT